MSDNARYLLRLAAWLRWQRDPSDPVCEGMEWRARLAASHLIGWQA